MWVCSLVYTHSASFFENVLWSLLALLVHSKHIAFTSRDNEVAVTEAADVVRSFGGACML